MGKKLELYLVWMRIGKIDDVFVEGENGHRTDYQNGAKD